MNVQQHDAGRQPPRSTELRRDLLSAIGYILGVSYPVLALSTSARAIYQLFVRDDLPWLGPALSAVAATCYLVATLGFLYRRRWSWYLSITSLGFESMMTLIVGTLSFVIPEVIGRTVWRHFGADYGYFPLFQPLLGLVWLVWPETRRAYGLRRVAAEKEH
ncbi:hypothetical protein [Kallotenue papyrolyticum]|uniref:hypothetical protein n=1 Tax=Kallotenue papyrolyticum TaxID=1325125 RepID=UPI0004785F4E|nr:hypothetical protein [Kallotenue papyrolyticum]